MKGVILKIITIILGTVLVVGAGTIFLSKQLPVISNNKNLNSTTTNIAAVGTASKNPIEKLYLVTKVIDGDTIQVNILGKIETVRLIGINTPETVDPRRPVECFGKEASRRAKELLENKKVKIEMDQTQGERDKYGRLLAYIYINGITLYNKLILEEGLAYEYTYIVPYLYQEEFKNAELEARKLKKGLWAEGLCDSNPETIRKSNTSNSASSPTSTVSPDGKWICSRNSYNCADFSSQKEAQEAFDSCGGTRNDIHLLDKDGDSKVCEGLQ